MRSMRTSIFLLLIITVSLCAGNARAQRVNNSLDTLKIVYFGSSVPAGVGATKMFGYTSMFTNILKQRAANGVGKAWTTVNKSIGGDNTIKLRARWQRDLVPQKAKYVLIALSLGNEGIHEFGQPKFDQFKANMAGLIQLARDSGYVPVIANCYTREDFTLKDYEYVKRMNLWINSLDVPSINLLGGVDNGAGKWAPAFWNDPAHPNNKGHRELSYTIVPSLFDALANHKPQPLGFDAANDGTNISARPIVFKPDAIVHPFTTTITIKANSKGLILQLKDSLNTGGISVNDKGFVEYKSPQYQKIIGNTSVTDGKWHTITVTHYYARNITQLYCDNTLEGAVNEQIAINELALNGDKTITAKNWLFYRSGMNAGEIEALNNKTLLKSSLELYAPLDAKQGVMRNLAQSMNNIRWVN